MPAEDPMRRHPMLTCNPSHDLSAPQAMNAPIPSKTFRTRSILLGLAATVSLAGAAPDDPYMGDWSGRLSLAGQAATDIAVYMIPTGDGTYEMRTAAAFNQRTPYLHNLRGRIQADALTLMDAIPFDVSKVVGATDRGVVIDATLWSGQLAGDTLRFKVAGKTRGECVLTRTRRTSPTLGKEPPKDAVILFDGKTLDGWVSANPKKETVEWKLLEDGAMEVKGKGGDIKSRETFNDHQLHLEFKLPYMPGARGQGRANSGVYLQGRYEVQILDSYGMDGRDNECGGLYKVSAPAVNMCFPPLQWQTYDITFHAPKFDAEGRKLARARITVVHNGVTIQDKVELPGVTGGAIDKNEAERGPLKLQDHGNPVQFRNIWAVRLP